jgi:acylphosphatase
VTDQRIVRVIARVTGHVQGVNYRATAAREARRRGLTGWVRNEPDGSVGGHFEGDDGAVEAMVEWCRHGPSYAAVRDVAVTETQPTGTDTFDIRY